MKTRITITLLGAALAALAACKSDHAPKAAPVPPGTPRFAVAVTENGFEPADVAVPAGKLVDLVFERKTDKTCAKQVKLEVGGQKIARDLPLNQPVEVAVTFPTAGKLTYTCGMDMIEGTISVQ